MKVKISQLKTDAELLDIRPVDPITKSRYRIAMRCGAEFPKMIVDKKTNAVVCGNHRLAAMLEEFGPDHVADVDAREFINRLAVFQAFTEDNMKHGRPLTGFALHRCGFAMLNEGMSPEQVARLLNIPMALFQKWGDRTVGIIGKAGTVTVPIKRGVEVPTRKMTQKQYAEHVKKDMGADIVDMAGQLTRWITNGWFDKENEEVMAALGELREAVNGI